MTTPVAMFKQGVDGCAALAMATLVAAVAATLAAGSGAKGADNRPAVIILSSGSAPVPPQRWRVGSAPAKSTELEAKNEQDTY